MKNLLSCFILTILALSAHAQFTTVVNGKYNSPYYGSRDKVTLIVTQFDTAKLTEVKIKIASEFNEEGYFRISSEEVIMPYTLAYLEFPGSRKTKIYLSPGDSLYGEFNSGSFESTIQYSGHGSGKNQYLNQRYLKFEKEGLNHRAYRHKPEEFIEKLSIYKNNVLEQLESFTQDGIVDSSFQEMEIKRIEYQYLKDLLQSAQSNIFVYSTTRDTISDILENVDCNNNYALYAINEYRTFIKLYIGFLSYPDKKENNEVAGKLRFAKQNLDDQTKRFYLLSLYLKAKDKSYRVSVEKDIILNYIIANVEDPGFKSIIDKHYSDSHKREISFAPTLEQDAAEMVPVVVIIILLIILLLTLLKWFGSKQIRFNYAAWLKYILIASILILMTLFIGRTFQEHKFLSVLFVVAMLAFFALHNFLLIPKYATKKPFITYIIFSLVSAVIYIILQLKIVTACIQVYPYFFGNSQGEIDNDVIAFLYGSVIILTYLSFLYYYVSLLANEKKGFSYLFKNKLISTEVLFNVLVISLISIPVIDNLDKTHGMNHLIIFLLGVSFFYIQSFILIPNYALKKRLIPYLLYNVLALIAITAVIFITDTMQSWVNIHEKGISISFIKLMFSNKSLDIPLTLASLWLIIPAATYSIARKKIIEQKNLGFSLFRKKEAELNQLRSQVNPHFLFNTLNTLYAFALKEKSDQTAESIAKLANLMRFMIDDMYKDEIPVKTELGYIEDYIALQSIRSSVKHKININISINEGIEYRIAPMLLIPFIENAFKHGMNPNKKSELKFDVKTDSQQMQFVIENSLDKNFEAFYKEKGFGIGIENVRKRLELIYPGRHNLSIAETNDRFIVILTIHLAQKP